MRERKCSIDFANYGEQANISVSNGPATTLHTNKPQISMSEEQKLYNASNFPENNGSVVYDLLMKLVQFFKKLGNGDPRDQIIEEQAELIRLLKKDLAVINNICCQKNEKAKIGEECTEKNDSLDAERNKLKILDISSRINQSTTLDIVRTVVDRQEKIKENNENDLLKKEIIALKQCLEAEKLAHKHDTFMVMSHNGNETVQEETMLSKCSRAFEGDLNANEGILQSQTQKKNEENNLVNTNLNVVFINKDNLIPQKYQLMSAQPRSHQTLQIKDDLRTVFLEAQVQDLLKEVHRQQTIIQDLQNSNNDIIARSTAQLFLARQEFSDRVQTIQNKYKKEIKEKSEHYEGIIEWLKNMANLSKKCSSGQDKMRLNLSVGRKGEVLDNLLDGPSGSISPEVFVNPLPPASFFGTNLPVTPTTSYELPPLADEYRKKKTPRDSSVQNTLSQLINEDTPQELEALKTISLPLFPISENTQRSWKKHIDLITARLNFLEKQQMIEEKNAKEQLQRVVEISTMKLEIQKKDFQNRLAAKDLEIRKINQHLNEILDELTSLKGLVL